VANGISFAFKSQSLEELLEIAARNQRLLGDLGPYGGYEFHATYDVDTGEWTGSFF
jgi:hypothetical protein